MKQGVQYMLMLLKQAELDGPRVRSAFLFPSITLGLGSRRMTSNETLFDLANG